VVKLIFDKRGATEDLAMRLILHRATRLGALALVIGVMVMQGAVAHHGWGWATDEEFEVTGTVTEVRLGNPHGEVTLDVAGERWVVEVGQPWRNDRAGLTSQLLAVGQRMTVHGHRSAKIGERLLKAERLVIDGKDYNLYPGRAS
jgi:hypothetical protein